MILWVRDEAYKLGFVIVITNHDSGRGGGMVERDMLHLDVKDAVNIRSTPHKEREGKTTLKARCLFKVKSYLLSSGRWSMNVVNCEHNHEMTKNFQSHKYVERFRPEEKKLVCELTKIYGTFKEYYVDP
jgi:hypothetical protein